MSLYRKRRIRPGAPPGLPGAAADAPGNASIGVVDYDRENLDETDAVDTVTACGYASSGRPTWVHVQGRPDVALLRAFGDSYGLHPLATEDVLHTGQRPKLEPYQDQLFVILQVPSVDGESVELHQLSLFLGQDWLISFFDGPADPFGNIRERLRNPVSPRIRNLGVDYLFYALLDNAVDLAFPALEVYAERIGALEETVFDNPTRAALDRIHSIKREMLGLRQALWPQREVLSALARDSFTLITDETRLFLRDCYDHTIQVMDLLESYREMGSALLDVYLSSVSNRMNDVMKVLTIISTMFIPLSFLVGVYGMNFDSSASPWNMPELGMRYGYPALLFLMLCIVLGMLYFFRRREWI